MSQVEAGRRQPRSLGASYMLVFGGKEMSTGRERVDLAEKGTLVLRAFVGQDVMHGLHDAGSPARQVAKELQGGIRTILTRELVRPVQMHDVGYGVQLERTSTRRSRAVCADSRPERLASDRTQVLLRQLHEAVPRRPLRDLQNGSRCCRTLTWQRRPLTVHGQTATDRHSTVTVTADTVSPS